MNFMRSNFLLAGDPAGPERPEHDAVGLPDAVLARRARRHRDELDGHRAGPPLRAVRLHAGMTCTK